MSSFCLNEWSKRAEKKESGENLMSSNYDFLCLEQPIEVEHISDVDRIDVERFNSKTIMLKNC